MHTHPHTPSIAFWHLPPRKDVVNQCLEFDSPSVPSQAGPGDVSDECTSSVLASPFHAHFHHKAHLVLLRCSPVDEGGRWGGGGGREEGGRGSAKATYTLILFQVQGAQLNEVTLCR